MSLANRKKHRLRQQKATLQKYGQVKLADAIEYLCKPYNNPELAPDAYQNLLAIAVRAWNIALATEDARTEKMQAAITDLPHFSELTAQQLVKSLGTIDFNQGVRIAQVSAMVLAQLIERKDHLYPNDDRMIIAFNYKVTAQGGGLANIKSVIPKRLDDR